MSKNREGASVAWFIGDAGCLTLLGIQQEVQYQLDKYDFPCMVFSNPQHVADAFSFVKGEIVSIDDITPGGRFYPPERHVLINTDDLTDAGFIWSIDNNRNLVVTLRDEWLKDALALVSLCLFSAHKIDTSSYSVMHEALSREETLDNVDERLVRCVGFPSGFLSNHTSDLVQLSSYHISNIARDNGPYNEIRTIAINKDVSVAINTRYGRAVPYTSFRSLTLVSDIILTESIDPLDYTVVFSLPNQQEISATVLSPLCKDPILERAFTHLCGFPKDLTPVVKERTNQPEDSSYSVIDERTLYVKGVVSRADVLSNPFTGEKFWSINVSSDGISVSILTYQLDIVGVPFVAPGHSVEATLSIVCCGIMPAFD